jgi:23S rRNA G2445 N2-methylase RlmL
MVARGIPPGVNRDFAFLHWPGADKARWNSLVDHARAKILKGSPARISASDRDEGAIAAARSNAERAGVAGDIEFDVKPISAAESTGKRPGLLIANPPYGERIGASDTIRNLYAQMGNTARKSFGGWRVALLSPGKQLDAQLKIAFEERFKTSNGGIPVRFVVGDADG